MQFERILNDRSQRFLTDVHTHKLTATIPVYPRKLSKSDDFRRFFRAPRRVVDILRKQLFIWINKCRQQCLVYGIAQKMAVICGVFFIENVVFVKSDAPIT